MIVKTLRELAAAHHRLMLVKRSDVAFYRRAMIATDLEHAAHVAPALQLLHEDALIELLFCQRIPFAGLRALFGTNRLKRAIENSARERMNQFVRATGLPRQRFELTLRDGFRDQLFCLSDHSRPGARPMTRLTHLTRLTHRSRRQQKLPVPIWLSAKIVPPCASTMQRAI